MIELVSYFYVCLHAGIGQHAIAIEPIRSREFECPRRLRLSTRRRFIYSSRFRSSLRFLPLPLLFIPPPNSLGNDHLEINARGKMIWQITWDALALSFRPSSLHASRPTSLPPPASPSLLPISTPLRPRHSLALSLWSRVLSSNVYNLPRLCHPCTPSLNIPHQCVLNPQHSLQMSPLFVLPPKHTHPLKPGYDAVGAARGAVRVHLLEGAYHLDRDDHLLRLQPRKAHRAADLVPFECLVLPHDLQLAQVL